MLGEKLQEKIEFRGETTFVILPADLREVAKFCGRPAASILSNITSVDNLAASRVFGNCLTSFIR